MLRLVYGTRQFRKVQLSATITLCFVYKCAAYDNVSHNSLKSTTILEYHNLNSCLNLWLLGYYFFINFFLINHEHRQHMAHFLYEGVPAVLLPTRKQRPSIVSPQHHPSSEPAPLLSKGCKGVTQDRRENCAEPRRKDWIGVMQ